MPVTSSKAVQSPVILLVEDEFFVRYGVADCLRDAGYVVVEAASGEEAIALCRSGAPVDIVFTDINLLGTATGWDVAEHFRAQRPDLPILYTSGKLVDSRRRVPGSTFVPKPYSAEHILKVCERLRAE